MFPQFKKINNESGIVLFLVLMTAIIIMIFSVGILTESANEANYAQQQIDQIESDQLAKGVFWNAYSSGTVMSGTQYLPSLENGRNYAMSMTSSANSPAISNAFTVSVNYDTFN